MEFFTLDKDESMQGRKSAVVVELSDEQREELERIGRSRTAPAGLVRRAQAVLAIANGMTFRQAMKAVDMSDKHLRKWCRRYLDEGIQGLNDQPGRGRKPGFSPLSGNTHRQTGM